MSEKIKGIIKNYFIDKKYGFITAGSKDYFFHITNINNLENANVSEIRTGMDVEFIVGPGKGGKPAAVKVWLKDKVTAAVTQPYTENNLLYLPLDTAMILHQMKLTNIDNYSLLLNKVARTVVDRGKEKFVLAERGQPISHLSSAALAGALKALRERQSKSIQVSGYSKQFELRPDWRLVIGLGSASVYETSLTLHHVYGFPYLPATSLKGVTRSYIIDRYYNGIEGNKEKGALADSGFCRIFGSPETGIKGALMGEVRFYDAYPVDTPVIKCDIMNPHYAPYYSAGEAPADYHSPVPIPFLTVEKTKFCIWIASDRISPIEGGAFDGKTPLEVVSEWLPKALQEHGIGAKTSVGYGAMTLS